MYTTSTACQRLSDWTSTSRDGWHREHQSSGRLPTKRVPIGRWPIYTAVLKPKAHFRVTSLIPKFPKILKLCYSPDVQYVYTIAASKGSWIEELTRRDLQHQWLHQMPELAAGSFALSRRCDGPMTRLAGAKLRSILQRCGEQFVVWSVRSTVKNAAVLVKD